MWDGERFLTPACSFCSDLGVENWVCSCRRGCGCGSHTYIPLSQVEGGAAMGGSGSSSRRKSSKRKRDKRKKTRRKESKKRRHVHDSESSYSDSESLNSDDIAHKSDHVRRSKHKKLRRDSSSMSSSSSDADKSISSDSDSLPTPKRSRKHRKNGHSRVVFKRKKKRDQKRSARPRSDSDAGSTRKRKRANSNAKSQRKSSKKRSRKYSSSDSESCSTCHSSSSDSKHPRSKAIFDEDDRWVKDTESNRTSHIHEDRFPSYYSSHSWGSDHNIGVNDGIGATRWVDNPRRLKSVIAVIDRSHGDDEGENRWGMDQHKEEIFYDREDYPSPKSLDSYEGGTKRVSVENIAGEEAQSEGALEDDFNKKATDIPGSAPAAGSGGDDLELILRQKALENLRKFRGKLPVGSTSTDKNRSNDHDVNYLSAGKADYVHEESTKQDSPSTQELSSRDGSSLLNEVKKAPDAEAVEGELRISEPTRAAPLGRANKDKGFNSIAVLTKQDLKGDCNPEGGDSIASNSSMAQSSTLAGVSTGVSKADQQNEDKDGSQFQQRMMSVMRGGEL
ncbi:uncharacterized protein LOC127265907 isoform X2 [Andrographis paniculata]|uniref:uncharacterized protein LOC127265907 isoform X2 n=1 Tax=Andrographis paniculata TaxID=175694 RepID=UPI0021E7DD98|nr:uncharacterized protein LOC127265907 isoform X2 [Andrographis paniculata]